VRIPDEEQPCLVTFHAHPDDEAIFTGGTVAMAVEAGWRVVLVVATSGEQGATPDWLTGDLATVRRAETVESARLLGIDRVEFLGYRDSGADHQRTRDPGGHAPAPAANLTLDAAPLDHVISQLRGILIDERASALTSYDRIGVYGHRDHVRVHEIAAEAVLGTSCDLVEATVSRVTLRRLRDDLIGRGLDPATWPETLVDTIGTDNGVGLLAVDVSAHLPQKLAAIAAHASQVVEASSFMGLPPGVFHRLLATEWFHPARTIEGRFVELVDSPFQRLRDTHDSHNSGLIQALRTSIF
jgi:LmbE family N-acetylglucosaminyl deacetylase